MNSEIKDFILSCEVCQKHSHAQPKEPLMPHPQPAYPWERVGTDIMKYENRNFLATVDYFSNFGEVDELTSTTASAVIRKLKAHFARCGIPAVLISDNGPQFASAELDEFATQWQFIQNTSSPGHAQSNEMVESAVKTAKSLLKKALESGHDPQLSFLDRRNTPCHSRKASPAQLMMGRRTRTTLLSTNALLKPRTLNQQTEWKNKTRRMQDYKTARELPTLKKGDTIRV